MAMSLPSRAEPAARRLRQSLYKLAHGSTKMIAAPFQQISAQGRAVLKRRIDSKKAKRRQRFERERAKLKMARELRRRMKPLGLCEAKPGGQRTSPDGPDVDKLLTQIRRIAVEVASHYGIDKHSVRRCYYLHDEFSKWEIQIGRDWFCFARKTDVEKYARTIEDPD